MSWIAIRCCTYANTNNFLSFSILCKKQNTHFKRIRPNVSHILYRCLSYYEILGVSRDANLKTIRTAYYAKCKEFHPDKSINNQNASKNFLLVQSAYETLKSAKMRKSYDDYLKSYSNTKQNFHEWQTFRTPGEQDFKQPRTEYNTVFRTSMGQDLCWSDLTFSDYASLFILIVIVLSFIYFINNLVKEKKVFNKYDHLPSSTFSSLLQHRQNYDLQSSNKPISISSSDPKNKTNNFSNPIQHHQSNILPSSKSSNSSQVLKKKNLKKKNRKNSNINVNGDFKSTPSDNHSDTEDKTLIVFKAIKTTGTVSSKELETFKKVTIHQPEQNDLNTWKKI